MARVLEPLATAERSLAGVRFNEVAIRSVLKSHNIPDHLCLTLQLLRLQPQQRRSCERADVPGVVRRLIHVQCCRLLSASFRVLLGRFLEHQWKYG
jgi:hypothetical protein